MRMGYQFTVQSMAIFKEDNLAENNKDKLLYKTFFFWTLGWMAGRTQV